MHDKLDLKRINKQVRIQLSVFKCIYKVKHDNERQISMTRSDFLGSDHLNIPTGP